MGNNNKSPLKVKTLVKRATLSLIITVSSFLAAGSAVVTPQSRPATKPQPVLTNQPTVQPSSKSGHETLAAASLDGKPLPYRVLLPSDYETVSRRYPVLYLLHGLTGNENDWVMRSRLTEYAARYHLIIIMPGVGDTWYANSATDPRARYEDVIINDLIPYVDSHYRTVASREGRAIAGLSMGGLGAMKFALRYPQLFAFAGSFSGAFDVPLRVSLGKKPSARILKELRSIYGDEKSRTRLDNDVFALLNQSLPKGTHFPYLYVSVGQSDPLPEVSDSNPRFAQALNAHKLKFEYNPRPGTHDWHFWDSEIELMLGRLCVMMPQICS
jgi:putative tributyrin esterase